MATQCGVLKAGWWSTQASGLCNHLTLGRPGWCTAGSRADREGRRVRVQSLHGALHSAFSPHPSPSTAKTTPGPGYSVQKLPHARVRLCRCSSHCTIGLSWGQHPLSSSSVAGPSLATSNSGYSESVVTPGLAVMSSRNVCSRAAESLGHTGTNQHIKYAMREMRLISFSLPYSVILGL